MLNYLNKNKKYYDIFNYFFTIDKKIAVFFSVNFIEILRSKTEIPEDFIKENIDFLKNQYNIKLFLTDKNNKYTESFDFLTTIELFRNSQFITYYATLDISNLTGKYKIIGNIEYSYSFYDYVSIQADNEELKLEDQSKFIKLKLIMDQNNVFFTHSAKNNMNIYSFESDLISFNKNIPHVSNFNFINTKFTEIVPYDEYRNFINDVSLIKGTTYDGNLPVTYFSNNIEEYALDFNLTTKTGDQSKYQTVMMNLLQNDSNSLDYKEFSSIQNIFLSKSEKNARKQAVPSYTKLNNNLESLACDNNVFTTPISSKTSYFKDSEILLIANYFNNIKDFKIDDFWKDDSSLIPVYLLDIFSTYKVYYLNSINPKSMSNSWTNLTNSELENLNPGKYLFKVHSEKDFVNPYLIENYFLLVK